jgi:hypothetical protein
MAFLAVAVVASYVPIWRPAKVNPMTHYQSNCRVRGDSLEASSGVIAMDSYPISPDPGLRNETRLNEAARRYACDLQRAWAATLSRIDFRFFC